MLVLGQNDISIENRKSKGESIVKSLTQQSAKSNISAEKYELENLVVVFEPNAARFEFHDVDNRILIGFLHQNYNVLLFNYVGFDSKRSQQYTLKVF